MFHLRFTFFLVPIPEINPFPYHGCGQSSHFSPLMTSPRPSQVPSGGGSSGGGFGGSLLICNLTHRLLSDQPLVRSPYPHIHMIGK